MDSLMNPHGGGRRVRGRALTVGTATVGLVALMLVGTAGTVLGHAVTAVSGTVDCAGNYTISVTGDVYDPVHLFITVGGTTIDEGLQGSNQSTRTFGPYTGTGAYAGEPIAAYPSDNPNNRATNTLVAQPSDCHATLKLVKQLSGNAPSGDHASDWTLSATATDASTPALTGKTPVTGQVAPGTYNLSESGGPSDSGNYTASSWACVSNSSGGGGASNVVSSNPLTLAAGDSVTCTITNSYSPPQGPTVNLTVEKLICPSYGVVPANSNYASEADYPNGKTLDTSYQTALTNPVTDTPEGCVPASGWQFDVGTGAGGHDYIGTVAHILTTGSGGTATLVLKSAEVAMIQSAKTWDQGLLVKEEMQAGATFGELRCYRDIENGDNLESIYNLQSSDVTNGVANLYCIAYNVAPPGTIIVKKVVANAYGGSTNPAQFSLYVQDSKESNVPGSPAAGSLTGTSYTLPAGTYSVGETTPIPSGYQLTDISCGPQSDQQSTVPAGLDSSTPANPATVDLVSGETVVCTVTNDGIPPQLTVVKHVDNSAGGTASASDFQMTVNGTNVQPAASFPGSETGTTVTLNVGSFSVTETHRPNYVETTSGDCSGAIALGDQKTCTVTNTYMPPPPPQQGFFYFTKTVTGNLNGWAGGTFSFTVTCNGQASSVNLPVPASGGSVSSQVFGPFNPGVTCSVSEGALPAAGTNATWVNSPTYSPAASVTVIKDTSTTVTVTNTRTMTSTPPPTSTPTPTPPATPTASATASPSPSGSVLGATGRPGSTGGVEGVTSPPSLPPTNSAPAGDGGQSNDSLLLLLGALGATSMALVGVTGLRGRLLERPDRR